MAEQVHTMMMPGAAELLYPSPLRANVTQNHTGTYISITVSLLRKVSGGVHHIVESWMRVVVQPFKVQGWMSPVQ